MTEKQIENELRSFINDGTSQSTETLATGFWARKLSDGYFIGGTDKLVYHASKLDNG